MKVKSFLILITLVFISCKTVKLSENENNYLLADSGKDKFYLVELIRQKQTEGKLGENPMLIINGNVIFYYYKKDIEKIVISKAEIKGLRISEAEKCVSLYGAGCKYGLVEINTYKSFE